MFSPISDVCIRAMKPRNNTLPSLDFDSAELAEVYEKISTYQFEHGKLLIEALQLAPGETVLDIGTGTGRLAVHAAAIVGPLGRITGIDPLPHRLAIARAKGCPNFETLEGRAEDMPAFADASFDAVYLNSVFHWIEDKPKALAEIFRVLKPGGRVALNTQDPTHPHELRLLIGDALAAAGLDFSHDDAHPAHGLDAGALETLMTDTGFTGFDGRLHTFREEHESVEAALAWLTSSSFGNFLPRIASAERARMEAHLTSLLEPRRAPGGGYWLERYMVFASAHKPGA